MNDEIRFLESKCQQQITGEWDLIASARDEQLRNNGDISFNRIFKPFVDGSVRDALSIVDIGCGTGRLTSGLRGTGRRVLGIDPSTASIRIARSHDSSAEYIADTLETWVDAHPHERFDLAVVNMVLMDVPDLGGFCRALSRIARGGRVIATITHPSFWPLYWNYASKTGFDYMTETIVEAPFRTTLRSYSLPTTHIHRPLSTYFDALATEGMTLTSFQELRGTESMTQFPFPRFIAFEASA